MKKEHKQWLFIGIAILLIYMYFKPETFTLYAPSTLEECEVRRQTKLEDGYEATACVQFTQAMFDCVNGRHHQIEQGDVDDFIVLYQDDVPYGLSDEDKIVYECVYGEIPIPDCPNYCANHDRYFNAVTVGIQTACSNDRTSRFYDENGNLVTAATGVVHCCYQHEWCSDGCSGTVCSDGGNCNTDADTNCDGLVSRSELGTFITKWVSGTVSRSVLGQVISVWVAS